MAHDLWEGIPRGWAYQGVTYSKAAPIWFVGWKSQKDLKDFVNQYFYIQNEMKVKDEEERNFQHEELFDLFPEVGIVYPYDRIGGIDEKLPNGTIIFYIDRPDERLGKGFWYKKYIRVAPSRIKRMPDYVF